MVSGATFILMSQSQAKADVAKEVLSFFAWAYGADGAKLASGLDYVPLPDNVVQQIQASWKANIKDSSGKPVY